MQLTLNNTRLNCVDPLHMPIFLNKYPDTFRPGLGACRGGGLTGGPDLCLLHTGLEHLRISASVTGPGTSPPWVPRDTLSSEGYRSYTWIFSCVGRGRREVSAPHPTLFKGRSAVQQSALPGCNF